MASCPAAASDWPIRNVVPPLSQGSCKLELDVCPSIFLPLDRIFSDLMAFAPEQMSGYMQNVGAKDGLSADPLLQLLQVRPNLAGLAVEPSEKFFPQLKKNMAKFRNLRLLQKGIAPSTAVDVLRYGASAGQTPQSMDIFKLDIDGCECHVLEKLLAGSGWRHPKIIQIELNHILPPPLSYKDMCQDDVWGRSTTNITYQTAWFQASFIKAHHREAMEKAKLGKDVWGCSMQAAYDIVQPHGYELLQYDWPDAVFVHRNYSAAFPCLSKDFMRNYWIGFHHAREHYSRFTTFVTNKTFVASVTDLAQGAAHNPQSALESIVATGAKGWVKVPLWIEMGVAGTPCRITVRRHKPEHEIAYHWHGCQDAHSTSLTPSRTLISMPSSHPSAHRRAANAKPPIHRPPPPLRVAVLYSGRFYGGLTQRWFDNHIDHFIRPNNASVFLAVSLTNWCDARPEARATFTAAGGAAAFANADERVRAAEEKMLQSLQLQAVRAFHGWPYLFTSLVTAEQVNATGKLEYLLADKVGRALDGLGLRGLTDGFGKSLSKNKHYVTDAMAYSSLAGWLWQFAYFAHAEALRRIHGPHDLILRARLDVTISTPILPNVLAREHRRLSSQRMLAIGFRAYTPTPIYRTSPTKCFQAGDPQGQGEQRCKGAAATRWYWRDWMYLGTADAIAPLATMVGVGDILTDRSLRVVGLSQEEQTFLHLRSSNVSLDRLDWGVALERASCREAKQATPMLADDQPRYLTPCTRCS